jgi:hypothetical protein
MTKEREWAVWWSDDLTDPIRVIASTRTAAVEKAREQYPRRTVEVALNEDER